MKEPYFTPQTIERKSKEMLSWVRKGWHRPRFAPERSALLVLDMQRYFLERTSHAYIPSAEAIIPRVQELAAAYSRRGLPVIFTRHLNSLENAGLMAKWWQELITPEKPLSEIISELDTENGIVLEKSQYDAFYRTMLEEILREKGTDQVVICGVLTHLCCETTARAAFIRGFEVFFAVDGTATYNEEFHRATLLNLAHGFAYPVLVKELIL